MPSASLLTRPALRSTWHLRLMKVNGRIYSAILYIRAHEVIRAAVHVICAHAARAAYVML